MASLYTLGETKVRPGVYRRYTTNKGFVAAGADDGTVAVVTQSDWGPLGVATNITTLTDLEDLYGNSTNITKTAKRALEAGASALKVVRVGSATGGAKGTYEIAVTSDETSVVLATLSTKYPSNRAFSVTLQTSLADENSKELIVYEGTTVIEKLTLLAGNNEIDNLVEAVNTYSIIFTAVKAAGAVGTLPTINRASITVGTNPTITTSDYVDAFAILEAYRFNVLCVDSEDTAIHTAVQAFVIRARSGGALFIAVVGEPITVTFATRISHAAAFNDECIVYVGGSAVDNDGNLVQGYEAAAIIAGMIAGTPSNDSIVHATVRGMSEIGETLTDAQHIQAIQNGCVMFSESINGDVWVESGVTTLITPNIDQDDGWKKIRRVKVRQEVMDRIDRTLEPLSGRLDNDADGIANVIKLGNDVLDAMFAEGKILAGYSFIEDPERPHKGDSAWFLIALDDIDSLEKIYLSYTFRYSAT